MIEHSGLGGHGKYGKPMGDAGAPWLRADNRLNLFSIAQP